MAATDLAAASPAVVERGPWRRALGRLVRRKGAMVGLAVVVFFVALAALAPWIAPYDPLATSWSAVRKAPSATHFFGTDEIGRDVLSRVIWGARASLLAGVVSVSISLALGVPLGLTAGYLGGWVDEVIMRLTDTWLALPALTFAIFLAAVMGPSEMNIIIVLACVYWTRYARVIRGEVLSLKEREFVRLAVIAGCSRLTIMRRHILPNVLNSAIVLATLMLGVVVVTEAALSFLGVGVPPPKPAWGLMLADGKRGLMAGYWWLTVLPGLCIMFLVLAANLLGDWLRVKLDPQLRQL
jgi:peptide/nickel transport system permease protein